MLIANNITMQFGAKPLFENVSVKFGEGNRYGLIGANGAGKSTFMKILAGVLEPSGGLGRAAHDFHQAHPAIARDRQALMVAEARHLDPGLLAGLNQGHRAFDLQLDPVDNDLAQIRHAGVPCSGQTSAAVHSRGMRLQSGAFYIALAGNARCSAPLGREKTPQVAPFTMQNLNVCAYGRYFNSLPMADWAAISVSPKRHRAAVSLWSTPRAPSQASAFARIRAFSSFEVT